MLSMMEQLLRQEQRVVKDEVGDSMTEILSDSQPGSEEDPGELLHRG